MRFSLTSVSLLFLLIGLGPITVAQVKLPKLISDGMVLQRDKAVKLWGWASPDEVVTIRFNDRTYIVKTGGDRQWQLTLPAMKAGGPYKMDISGKNHLVIKDILFGDVWICSGQSNMEFVMSRVKDKYAAQIAGSANPNIRQFFIYHQWNLKPQTDVKSNGWREVDPQTILQFTAVGYFFAKQLYEKYHVPIGLISSSVGGTPAEAWTSADGLKELPNYLKQIKPYQDSAKVAEIVKKEAQLVNDWNKRVKEEDKGSIDQSDLWKSGDSAPSGWKPLTIPGTISIPELKNFSGILWIKKEIELSADMVGKNAELHMGNFSDWDTTYVNGQKVGYTNSRYYTRKYLMAGNLLKAGKNVIVIRMMVNSPPATFTDGKLYQLTTGNTNIPLTGEWQYRIGVTVDAYPKAKLTNFSSKPTVLYNSMIAPLLNYSVKGVIWYQGEANTSQAYAYRTLFKAMINDWRGHFNQGDFPFLLVQLAGLRAKDKEPKESTWAELREAQAMALALPNTGMAVAHDLGEWNDIHPLNKMDVGTRLALVAQKVAYNDKSVVYSGPVYQSMKVKNNQCSIHFTNIGTGLQVKNGGELSQFAIAGADRKFVWANARIEGDNVIVWSDVIDNPVAVRYAWSDNPEGANLYNKEGLPALAFRTDDWPGLTVGK